MLAKAKEDRAYHIARISELFLHIAVGTGGGGQNSRRDNELPTNQRIGNFPIHTFTTAISGKHAGRDIGRQLFFKKISNTSLPVQTCTGSTKQNHTRNSFQQDRKS